MEVITCGYEKLGLENPKWKKQGFEDRLHAKLLERLREVAVEQPELKVDGIEKIDLTYHVMDQSNPGSDNELKKHWGENARIMLNMVELEGNAAAFEMAFRRLKAWLKNLCEDRGRRKIVIAIVCRSGRHRSVCLAKLLRWALQTEGFSSGAIHMNSDEWQHLCTDCSDCSGNNWLKARIRERAIAMWRSM